MSEKARKYALPTATAITWNSDAEHVLSGMGLGCSLIPDVQSSSP